MSSVNNSREKTKSTTPDEGQLINEMARFTDDAAVVNELLSNKGSTARSYWIKYLNRIVLSASGILEREAFFVEHAELFDQVLFTTLVRLPSLS